MAGSTDGLRAGATVLHVTALVTTTYRLVHRARIQRFSWDDGFALMASLLGTLELLCLWLVVVMGNKYPFGSPTFNNVQSGLFWTVSISFTFLVSSVFFVIYQIRGIANMVLRNTYVALAIATFVSAVALVAIKASMCAYTTELRIRDYPITCAASARKFVVVFQSISGYSSGLLDSSLKILFVTVDIALSLLLIVMPIHALRSMDLPRAKRNLLILVFTGSIGTLVAALVHNVYVLRRNFRLNFFTTHYQVGVPCAN
ncbi:hypothetical protein PQX77_018733 [Marasmius sp. AFHP31]|nr:hypothetical protein PQX77_018733 [Marasmius sp. AFHP31]